MNNKTTLTKTIKPNDFTAFLATYGGERCKKMLGSTASAHTLFDLVYSTSQQKLPELGRWRKHLTRELCVDVWPLLSGRQRTCAGMCMVFMARESLLPIMLHQTKSGSGSKKYWIDPDRVGVAVTPST